VRTFREVKSFVAINVDSNIIINKTKKKELNIKKNTTRLTKKNVIKELAIGLVKTGNNGMNIIKKEERRKKIMGKFIEAVKQFKEVIELREENKILYDEKTFLEVELEQKDKQYEITKKRCQQFYKLFNEIKEIANENQNGSVINMQNRIKTKLKEFKL
jgi:hypothetical protein